MGSHRHTPTSQHDLLLSCLFSIAKPVAGHVCARQRVLELGEVICLFDEMKLYTNVYHFMH